MNTHTPKTKKTNGKTAATIPRHNIKSLQSFLEATKGPRRLAGLYFYMKLDCLISLACEVSDDFFSKRPHLYSKAQDNEDVVLARILATLKARAGYHELFPSLEQRNDIYLRYFGRPDDLTSKFYHVTQPLLDAAREFLKNAHQNNSKNDLRESVRKAHLPCKHFYEGLDGAALAWHKEQALLNLTEEYVYKILRNDEVAKVFGVAQSISDEFPYKEDSNANKLLEMIANTLRGEVSLKKPITRHFFSKLHRCALSGCATIATVLDFEGGDPDDVLDILIEKCLAWATALRDIDEYLF